MIVDAVTALGGWQWMDFAGFLIGQCVRNGLWMDVATALWIAMLMSWIGMDPGTAMTGMW